MRYDPAAGDAPAIALQGNSQLRSQMTLRSFDLSRKPAQLKVGAGQKEQQQTVFMRAVNLLKLKFSCSGSTGETKLLLGESLQAQKGSSLLLLQQNKL